MTKNVKVLLGVISLLVVVAVGVFAVNPSLGQGLTRATAGKYTCGSQKSNTMWTNIFNESSDTYYSENPLFTNHNDFLQKVKNGYFDGTNCNYDLTVKNSDASLSYDIKCNKLSYNESLKTVDCINNSATANLYNNGVRIVVSIQWPDVVISNGASNLNYSYFLRDMTN